MSSFPSRLAKRALSARGFVRQWTKPNDDGRTFPTVVLDPDGKAVATTWVQAAVVSSAQRRAGWRA